MSTIQDARRILGEAEASLRGMMEESLKEQRYGDVAGIANLANGLAALLRAPSEEASTAAPPSFTGGAPEPRKSALPPRGKPLSRGASRTFPRFHRDGNRLVKVGWSKKRKKEYEHRAPRDSVDAFARHLVSKVSMGKVFRMEDLLPVPDLRGAELPSYQAYLCLAWLQEVGILKRKGKDGYTLGSSGLAQGRLEEIWNALPSGEGAAGK